MTVRRGWDIAVSVCLVMLTLLAVLSSVNTEISRIPLAVRGVLLAVGLAALLAYYLIWARPRLGTESEGWGVLAVVVIGALLTLSSPNMFTAQVIIYPLIWQGSRGLRRPVIVSALAAIAMTTTSILGAANPDWISSAIAIGLVSYAFNLAMGLWISGIARVGSENARLYAELQLRQEEIAALNRDAGAMHERGRLSRDLHDTVAQTLTGVVMLSRSALRQAESGSPKLVDTVRLIESSAAEALAETRAMVAMASSLEESTLAETLERFCTRFSRETGISVDLRLGLDQATVLTRAEEVILLRCVQEGLANVRKHSGANAVRIETARTDAGIRLTLADNGRGPGASIAVVGGQFGLAGLAERLAGVGGAVALAADPGGGALLSVDLPLASVAAPIPKPRASDTTEDHA
ncbi:sensor histidine kinase [Mycetocola tolaasinivorans]|nr:sensor histidine kinase [Mycetocola tolaasinivorans]